MHNLFNITPLTDSMRDALAGHFAIQHIETMGDPIAWLDQHGGAIEYVLTDGHYGLKPEYLERLPALKLISSNGVGYDAIDTQTAVARNILVTHTPTVLNAEVATTALMLFIDCYRRHSASVAYARAGRWQAEGGLPLSRSADNRTVGILGLGRIGMTIAEKLAPFNPRIVYHGRTSRDDVDFRYYDNLVEMATDVDALICVTPGGAGTHHLINGEVMDALGKDSVLINVGRGSVVDEDALIAALTDQRLGAAGLDVFAEEPKIPEALRALPNVVLTPHIGSATVETRAAMAKLAIDNLLQFRKDGTVISPVPECKVLL